VLGLIDQSVTVGAGAAATVALKLPGEGVVKTKLDSQQGHVASPELPSK
jgi:hypothetical protein